MIRPVSSDASMTISENEDLSEEQIYQLLKDAEQRLGSALRGSSSGSSLIQKQLSMPGLQEG
jgi:hypothetical protein